jgi:hypothetical protein
MENSLLMLLPRFLEDVCTRYCDKLCKISSHATFNAETNDCFVLHAPYNKPVQKSCGRLFFELIEVFDRKDGKRLEIDGSPAEP